MMIRDTTNLMAPKKAEEVAKELQKADPDWKYVVKHDPKGKGFSFIEIYDESGVLVGKV